MNCGIQASRCWQLLREQVCIVAIPCTGVHSLQRQKAEAAETQSSKLAGQLEKEQADNAKSSAKLKGTEKHITDVLAQIGTVREMHHLLLQTLGEASDSIQSGGLQNAHMCPAELSLYPKA